LLVTVLYLVLREDRSAGCLGSWLLTISVDEFFISRLGLKPLFTETSVRARNEVDKKKMGRKSAREFDDSLAHQVSPVTDNEFEDDGFMTSDTGSSTVQWNHHGADKYLRQSGQRHSSQGSRHEKQVLAGTDGTKSADLLVLEHRERLVHGFENQNRPSSQQRRETRVDFALSSNLDWIKDSDIPINSVDRSKVSFSHRVGLSGSPMTTGSPRVNADPSPSGKKVRISDRGLQNALPGDDVSCEISEDTLKANHLESEIRVQDSVIRRAGQCEQSFETLNAGSVRPISKTSARSRTTRTYEETIAEKSPVVRFGNLKVQDEYFSPDVSSSVRFSPDELFPETNRVGLGNERNSEVRERHRIPATTSSVRFSPENLSPRTTEPDLENEEDEEVPWWADRAEVSSSRSKAVSFGVDRIQHFEVSANNTTGDLDWQDDMKVIYIPVAPSPASRVHFLTAVYDNKQTKQQSKRDPTPFIPRQADSHSSKMDAEDEASSCGQLSSSSRLGREKNFRGGFLTGREEASPSPLTNQTPSRAQCHRTSGAPVHQSTIEDNDEYVESRGSSTNAGTGQSTVGDVGHQRRKRSDPKPSVPRSVISDLDDGIESVDAPGQVEFHESENSGAPVASNDRKRLNQIHRMKVRHRDPTPFVPRPCGILDDCPEPGL